MNKKSVLKKLSLDEAAFDEIKSAVKNAEKRTSGEIALALACESSTYAFWELRAAVFTGVLLLACLFPMASQIYAWLGSLFWGVKPWYLAAFFVIVIALVILILYFAYNIPFVDSFIVPEKAKSEAVNSRALRYFAESGVYCTKSHCGVLIYVSYFEKRVRIIADKGINEKISSDLWDLIADEMTDLLKCHKGKEAFLSAVNRCGELLAEYFPADENNCDELENGLCVLEESRWL